MESLSYFKIGLFVIGALVVGVTGIVVLGAGAIFQKSSLIETYIDESVQGLDVGSAVKFRGVPVGRVERISLTSAEYSTRRQYVLVRISITANVFQFPVNDPTSAALQAELDRGFRVRLAPQGLTGVAYIEADYLDPDRHPPLEIDWQPSYPYIPSTRSRITQLSEAVERILNNIGDIDMSQLAASVEKSLAAMTKLAESADLEKVGAQAGSLLTEVRDTNRKLSELLGNPELRAAIADGAAAAKTAREIMEGADKPMKQLLADLPKAANSLNGLVSRLDEITGELPETTGQMRQTLRRLSRLLANQQYEIESTVDNLRAISENVRELTEDSKRFPAQAIFGAPPAPAGVLSR